MLTQLKRILIVMVYIICRIIKKDDNKKNMTIRQQAKYLARREKEFFGKGK